MKYIRQFLIILFISFIGELLNHYIPLPFPASIYGIVIMFVCLFTGIIKVEHVKEVSGFLIEIMPLVFIPAAVGLINSWGLISTKWYMYVTVIIATTVLVMAVSGLMTQFAIRYEKKHSTDNLKSYERENNKTVRTDKKIITEAVDMNIADNNMKKEDSKNE